MDKYFETLDMAAFRMMHDVDSPKATKLFRHVLDTEHDAGPEADYIIRVWKKARKLNRADA
tara:strand:- start:617 stop:799 length:183 start_codon:yes stop_codon:yes gene_type:complete